MPSFFKIVETTYPIYQGLSKRRLCKEHLGRKVSARQGLICAEILCFKSTRDLDELYYTKPTIWSHDTGQRIPCFDSCQLTITWMSNIKDVTVIMVLLLSTSGVRTYAQSCNNRNFPDRSVIPNFLLYEAPFAHLRRGRFLLLRTFALIVSAHPSAHAISPATSCMSARAK